MDVYKLINTVWAGLRGALGIVLSLIVEINYDNLGISKHDASLQFFYIGGIATLTLIINAPTAEKVLLALGLIGRKHEVQNITILHILCNYDTHIFLIWFSKG